MWPWLFIVAIAVAAVAVWLFVLRQDPSAVSATAAAEAPAPSLEPTPTTAPDASEKPVPRGKTPSGRGAGTGRNGSNGPTPAAVAPQNQIATPPTEASMSPAQPNSAPDTAPPAAVPSVATTTYDATSAGVTPPMLLTSTVNPIARKDTRSEPGSPAIEVLINTDGSVQSVKAVTRPSTIGQTLEMVNGLSITKSWRFDPALRDGQPVKYRLLVPLSVLAARRAGR